MLHIHGCPTPAPDRRGGDRLSPARGQVAARIPSSPRNGPWPGIMSSRTLVTDTQVVLSLATVRISARFACSERVF